MFDQIYQLKKRLRVLELELLDRKVQELDKPKYGFYYFIDLYKGMGYTPAEICEILGAGEAARSASLPLVDPQ